QPQVSTVDRRLMGAEALMRWHHPERGLLSPISFMEILSEKPIAPQVGEWVLRTACTQLAEWRRTLPDLRIGVNLFQAQTRSRRLLSVVREVLEENALPPEAIELEIVETILLRNDTITAELLNGLSEMGI